VCIQQHQRQHVTAQVRNSDDAGEDAVQLVGLGGAVEEAHQPVPEEQQKKETHPPVPDEHQKRERESKGLVLVHILQEKKGGLCR